MIIVRMGGVGVSTVARIIIISQYSRLTMAKMITTQVSPAMQNAPSLTIYSQ